MPRIAPCLWYDSNALDAARFYVSLFENSKIEYWSHYTEGAGWPSPLPAGTPLNVRFTLCGQEFDALNGGPLFHPTPALSFYVDCETEGQLDALWQALGEGGEVLMELDAYPFSQKFGWLNDRFGASWQLSFSGMRQKITPYLLFAGPAHGRAGAAINAWRDIFGDTKPPDITLYGPDADAGMQGTVMFAAFELAGQLFMAADGGSFHAFTFTEGDSLILYCEDQAEIDDFWEKLGAGGEEQPCGWLKDRFGVSWQIVPREMETLGDTTDPVRAGRVSHALLQMKKIDLQALRDAYNMQP